MSTKVSVSAEVYKQPDGKWAIDNGLSFRICRDKDAVGQYLEESLWPLLAPALNRGIEVKITVNYEIK